MAQLNLVKITKVEYADVDTSLATLPTVLKTLTDEDIYNGTANVDIPEASITPYYNEKGGVVHTVKDNVQAHFSLGLIGAVTMTMADFLGGTYTAATATDPEQINFDGTDPANKYIKISGKNTDNQDIVIELYNAMCTTSWSGTVSRTGEPTPITVNYYANKNKGYGKTMIWKAGAKTA